MRTRLFPLHVIIRAALFAALAGALAAARAGAQSTDSGAVRRNHQFDQSRTIPRRVAGLNQRLDFAGQTNRNIGHG